MAECLLGQPSWRTTGGQFYGYGHSQAESCGNMSAGAGGGQWRWSGAACVQVSNPSVTAVAVQVCDPYVLPPYIPSSGAGPVTAACTASAPCVVTLPPDGSDILYGAMWALGVVILFALGYTGGRAR